MPDIGRNAGITGFIDLPAVGTALQVRCYGFDQAIEATLKDRLGRGSGFYPGYRPLTVGGYIAVLAQSTLQKPPLPDNWENATGTLTMTECGDAKQTVTVRVEKAKFTNIIDPPAPQPSTKTTKVWKIDLVCRILSSPVFEDYADGPYHGGPYIEGPYRTDMELWKGTSKTIDPQGLSSKATRRIDVWGNLNDTDASERQRLADIISATIAPMTGQKVRSATFQRDSLDGGEVIIEFGVRDTSEDITYEASKAQVTPLEYAEAAVATVIPTGIDLWTKAQQIANSNFNDPLFEGVELKRLTASKALQIIRQSNGDKLFSSSGFHKSQERVAALVDAWGDDVGQVLVSDIGIADYPSDPPDQGHGSTEVMCQHRIVERTRGRVTLLRRKIIAPGSLASLYKEDWSNTATTNNAEFLGYSAHALLYAMHQTRYCVAIADAHLVMIAYTFMYDSLLHQNDGMVNLGWTNLRTDAVHPNETPYSGEQVLINSTGFKPCDWFQSMTPIITWPTEQDYSWFLT